MRACAEEAKGSSTLMSAASERPSIAPFPTSKLVPGLWPIAATTSSRGSTPARRLGRADSRRRGPGGWAGSAAAAPAVRERSFIALRVIQSRNRKRTARKPNLSATARGSSTPASVELEGEVGDAELEAVVRVELDLRPAGQGEALLAAVLQQVVGQLLAQGRLVARELLAVLRRQEEAVVIGHVDAGDGDHLVVLHLLGQLVRQLDRLHARLERAAERALHQAAELRLQ